MIAANPIGQTQQRQVNIDKPSQDEGRGAAGKITACGAC